MRAASQYSVEALYDELWVWAQASLGYVDSAVGAIPALSGLPPPVVRAGGILVPWQARRRRTFEIGGGADCRKGQNETNWRKLDHCQPLPESGNDEITLGYAGGPCE
jgi:hypothetical protein